MKIFVWYVRMTRKNFLFVDYYNVLRDKRILKIFSQKKFLCHRAQHNKSARTILKVDAFELNERARQFVKVCAL